MSSVHTIVAIHLLLVNYLALEWIHEEILSDFNSTISNDPEGNLLVVDNMLRAINNILSNCNRTYSTIPVKKVNIIKTLIATALSVISSCEIKDKIQISNFIASDDTLIEVIVLLINSKGSTYVVHVSVYLRICVVMHIPYMEKLSRWNFCGCEENL